MLLWAFDIKKSEARDPKTGQLFKYSAADSAFCGDVRVLLTRILILMLRQK